MAVKSRAVSVTTSATRVDTSDETDSRSGSAVLIYNNGAQTVYLGGSDVTTANGFPLAAGSSLPVNDIDTTESVYGIVTATTAEVRVLEAGV